MLRSLGLFFKKEPRYFFALGAILAFYVFYFSMHGLNPERRLRHGERITAFQAAEKQWNKDLEREEVFEGFVKQKPVLALLFQVMTGFFFFAFLAGIVIDAVLLWKKVFLRGSSGALSPPLERSWPFSILFKVVILFVSWGIILSLLMGAAEGFFPKAVSDNFCMILHTLLLHAITLYYMIKFITQHGSRWQELGLQLPSGSGILGEIKAGLMGYCGVLPLFVAVVAILFCLSSFIRYEPPPHPLMNVFLEEKHAPFLIAVSLLLGAVIGPVCEEIFFRGFCYQVLRNQWGKFWAMVLSAAFFAGVHYSGFVFWPLFVMGMALAYLYEKRRSLIASITLHVMHNTIFIAYFFLVRQILGNGGT